MTSKRTWKDGLLSSSLPLEFEVAKILVSRGFAVEADYTFSRYDANILKNFSADIYASAYPPFSDEDKINAAIFLLLECKYRTPNKRWLFMPEPNSPRLSNFIIGHTIRVVDEFSPYYFSNKSAIYAIESKLPVCYKGAEINLTDGDVYDADIKQGIAQLRYALPRLLKDSILGYINRHPEDNVPFIFCPILVTTANLHLMNKKTTLPKVKAASDLGNISKQVPYLILYSDYGPYFEGHCRREFVDLANVSENQQLPEIERKHSEGKGRQNRLDSPYYLLGGLVQEARHYMLRYFT